MIGVTVKIPTSTTILQCAFAAWNAFLPFFTIVVTTISIEVITFPRLALMRLSVASAVARAV